MSIDFKSIANQLSPSLPQILSEILPGGKTTGREYRCASILGGEGESFAFNLESQVWKDFSTGHTGGKDIISLYAEVKGIKQVEAAKELVARYALPTHYLNGSAPKPALASAKKEPTIIPAPLDARGPDFSHSKFGKPSAVYRYADKSRIYFYVARYDLDGKKELRPYSYTADGKWISKGYPEPRPLYMQDRWQEGRTFIVVEGEKAAEALYEMLGGKYNVTTWANGTNAVEKADLKPILSLQKILLWPDADEPGITAMHKLAAIIHKNEVGCEIYTINTEGLPKGFDAADLKGPVLDFIKSRKQAWAPTAIPEIVNEVSRGTRQIDPQEVGERVQEALEGMPVNQDRLDLWHSLGIPHNKSLQPILNEDTIKKALTLYKPLGLEIYNDTFLYRTIISYVNMEGQRVGPEILIKKKHGFDITSIMQGALGLTKLNKDKVNDTLDYLACQREESATRLYMESLKWDGTPRIDTFFSDYVNCQKNEYTMAVSKNFWIAMAARTYSPGCKFDNMVVLEGMVQGAGKTTLLEIISKGWVCKSKGSFEDKDFYQNMEGCLIVEFGEMHQTKKADINLLKDILSDPRDKFRRSYGEFSEYFPRQSIFVGTTNDTEYLNDETGGRRFWPIRTNGTFDLNKIKENLDQFYAEAVARYKKGETWHEVPTSDAIKEQEIRRVQDPWEEEIAKFLYTQPERYNSKRPCDEVVTCEVIINHFLNTEKLRLNDCSKGTRLRIGKCLRALGWMPAEKAVRINGRVSKQFTYIGNLEPENKQEVMM